MLPVDKRADQTIDAALADWLREDAPPAVTLDADRVRLLLRIDLNGVGALLALKSDRAKLHEDLAQALQQRLIAREMWEEQHRRVLAQALDALKGVGLNPILMKGTALAYSHYPRPSARVRGDTDILVEPEGRARAFEALEKAGFRRPLSAGGLSVVAEAPFQKADLAGQDHDIDLHWRLNSSPVVAALFTHAELLANAKPIEALHPSARRLGNVDSLLFAAVHRRLHVDRPTHIHLNGVAHPVIDTLSWLMDIDLLFSSLTNKDCKRLVEQARLKGIADILAETLRRAQLRLGTNVPQATIDELEAEGQGVIARYISAPPVRALLLNLEELSGVSTKARYLHELFLPSGEYMRARFSRGQFDWLPVLHLRRILPGILKHIGKGQEVP